VAVLDHSDYGPWEYQFAAPPAENALDVDCYSSKVAPGMQWSAEALDKDYGSDARVKLTVQVGSEVIDGFTDFITKRPNAYYANATTAPVELSVLRNE